MTKNLNLSPLECSVWHLIEINGDISVSTIADTLYSYMEVAPKNPNNSVISAIRQINRKLKKAGLKRRIIGENKGRSGKIVWIGRQK